KSIEPQGTQGRETHQRGRGRVAIPAILQPRHEPDREGLLQAQGLLAKNSRKNRGRLARRPRCLRGHIQTNRMRQLLQGSDLPGSEEQDLNDGRDIWNEAEVESVLALLEWLSGNGELAWIMRGGLADVA